MGSSKPQAYLVIPAFLVLLILTSARAYPWFADRKSITNNRDADVKISQYGITRNGTLGNHNVDITCSGEHFGLSPNIQDCHSARRHVPPDTTQRNWGQRHTGLSEPYFPLPYRIMGGELHACPSTNASAHNCQPEKGLCFFEAVIVDDKEQVARASLFQIKEAAESLIFGCATVGKGQGGIAKNIGQLCPVEVLISL